MHFKKILFCLTLSIAMIQAMQQEPTSSFFDIIATGEIPTLKTYLQEHPEVNIKKNQDDFRRFALNVAVEDPLNPNPEMIKFLLDKGAIIDSLNMRNETPLLFAMKRYMAALSTNNIDYDLIHNLHEIIKILLQRGTNPNVLSLNGETAWSINAALIKSIIK